MSDTQTKIRVATPADAEDLLAIYAPYVTDTAISFEYEVPSVADFRKRIWDTLLRYPYLVAEREDRIVGFAYAGPFKERAAYDWSVETSIYVDQNFKRRGIGGELHEALKRCLQEQGILNMEACIAVPSSPDRYLNRNSVEFHAHLGYRTVGTFSHCGHKFQRWYNMMWMELKIGHHGDDPKPPKTFAQVYKTVQEKYGITWLDRA